MSLASASAGAEQLLQPAQRQHAVDAVAGQQQPVMHVERNPVMVEPQPFLDAQRAVQDMRLVRVRMAMIGGELGQPAIAEMPGAAVADMQDMAAAALEHERGEGACGVRHVGHPAHRVQPAVVGREHAQRRDRGADRVGLVVQPVDQRADAEFGRHAPGLCAADAIGERGDHAVAVTFGFGRGIDADKILVVGAFPRRGRMARRNLQSTLWIQAPVLLSERANASPTRGERLQPAVVKQKNVRQTGVSIEPTGQKGALSA
jgi:hypothetical protein